MLKKYSFLIGFLLLAIIISQTDLESLYQTFKKTNYQILIPALLLAFPLILVKAYRWNYLKKLQGINYKITDSFLMYGVATAIGSLTPGRLGEISKISYLKKDGYPIGQSLTNVIIDRLLDLFFLITFGYLGIIFFFGFFKKITLIYSLIIISIILLTLVIKKRLYYQLFKKIFFIIIPLKYQKSWQANFQDFLNSIKIYNKKNYLYLSFITFLAWLIYYSQIYLFAKSINLDQVPLLNLIMAVTVSGFITLLPISFLGIGTRETILVALLSPLTANIEVIILLSELILLDFVTLGIIGMISWWVKPIPLTKTKINMLKHKIISLILKKSNIGRLSDLIKRNSLLKIPYKFFSQRMISYDFPIHLFIETTNACNLKCKFCARTNKKFQIGSMDFSLFKKIINEAKQYGPRTFSLHLFGEPLLTKNIFEMVNYIKKTNKNNTIFLTTNGTLLNKRMTQSIIESSVDKISISFPGAKKQTYQKVTGFNHLETVEKNILNLIELKKIKKSDNPTIYLRMVLTKDNITEKEIFENKWENKPVVLEIRAAHNFGGYCPEASLRKKQAKRYPCYHLWLSPAIHWNGDVSICCDDWGKKTLLGNIKNQTMHQIWNSEKIKQYRKSHLKGNYHQVPLCGKCDVWTMYEDIFFNWQKK